VSLQTPQYMFLLFGLGINIFYYVTSVVYSRTFLSCDFFNILSLPNSMNRSMKVGVKCLPSGLNTGNNGTSLNYLYKPSFLFGLKSIEIFFFDSPLTLAFIINLDFSVNLDGFRCCLAITGYRYKGFIYTI
jgi:hypothetical protein